MRVSVGVAAMACLSVIPLVSGCGLTRYVSDPDVHGFERQCTAKALPTPPVPVRSQETLQEPPNLRSVLRAIPVDVHDVAEVIGLVPLLAELQALKASGRQDGVVEVRLLRVYQRIQGRLMLAMAEVSSTAGVLRCEESRADELADSMEKNQTRRSNRLTILAIVLGGITDAVTSGLSLLAAETASAVFGVGAGVTQTVPGIAALYPNIAHEFFHSHNYLADVWSGPAHSAIFPESIWRFLIHPREGEKSLREQILQKWKERLRIEGASEDEQRHVLELLLGEGGFYGVAELRARRALLQLLSSSIELMHDDLEILIRELLVREPELAL